MKPPTATTVEQYILNFPPEVQDKLNDLRAVIRREAPDAVEKISYGMPAYVSDGMLVYFAAFTNHISVFPGTSGVAAFSDRLSDYKCSKGTIQFSATQPLPLGLIAEITRFRLEQNRMKALVKKRK